MWDRCLIPPARSLYGDGGRLIEKQDADNLRPFSERFFLSADRPSTVIDSSIKYAWSLSLAARRRSGVQRARLHEHSVQKGCLCRHSRGHAPARVCVTGGKLRCWCRDFLAFFDSIAGSICSLTHRLMWMLRWMRQRAELRALSARSRGRGLLRCLQASSCCSAPRGSRTACAR